MKAIYGLTGALVLMLAVSGCAPKVAQSELTVEEQKWEAYIGENYSAWQRPTTLPRWVKRTDTVTPTTLPGVAVTESVETVAVDATPALMDPPATAADAAPVAASEEFYTVKKGDTLGGIALKYYGRAGDWKRIQEANAAELKGKTLIVPGAKLRIPRP